MGTNAKTDTAAKMRKAIFFGRKKLAHMDEEAFSALVKGVAGHDDLKNMDTATLGKVLDAMRKAGFAPKENPETAAIQGRIRALWGTMHEEGIVSRKDGLDGYCIRLCRRTLDGLTVKQCQSVLECLKNWYERETLCPRKGA